MLSPAGVDDLQSLLLHAMDGRDEVRVAGDEDGDVEPSREMHAGT
jgi:hypothetical protein